MSPRAAWRLEQLGFEAYDYAGGKMDWLSYGLPYEGEAELVSHRLSPVPSVRSDVQVGEVRHSVAGSGPGVVAVTNEREVLLGLLRAEELEGDSAALASEVMREGPTTVRPSEEVGPLRHRMEHAGVELMLVTRSDGVLLGAFSSRDR